MKKYVLVNNLTKEFGGRILYRIVAIKDFGYVKAGDLGGYVENESNLSHEGNCWVFDKAIVCDNAIVSDNACVYKKARVIGNARVFGNASVTDNAMIDDNVYIYGSAYIHTNARVSGNAEVCDRVCVGDNASIYGHVKVCGKAIIVGDAHINSQNDYMSVLLFGESITFFRCSDNIIKIFYSGNNPKITTYNGEKGKRLFKFREFYNATTDLYKEGGVFFSLCVAVKRYFNI